ncbi:beta-ketoacyl synthase N-terminal-like domain-containing protein, partial [Aquimarina aggregata]|uniref:type I polyketide synthase n=1 Tax=Aquimarina aggregata TaxID=1642818 RepID=UPI0024920069
KSAQEQVVVYYGDKHRIVSDIIVKQATTTLAVKANHQSKHSIVKTSDISNQTISYLKSWISQQLKIDIEQLQANDSFEKYGIDSILVTKLTQSLEKIFGVLPKTLFFEYLTIKELATYFTVYHVEKLDTLFLENKQDDRVLKSTPIQEKKHIIFDDKTKENRTEKSNITSLSKDIAIIGLSGRYPKASNINTFWENLKSGKDCITEIPKDRWNADAYFDPEKRKKGTSNSKWGGFIKDVDKFDHSLFNITPREAKSMDPQERIFLENIWETIEDAGYTKSSLRKGTDGNIGVYVGVMYEEYPLYSLEERQKGNHTVLMGNPSSIANRVSYYFDFNGPSMAIDTMCSSSLTAIHLACDSIKSGSCEMALAGGVNLSIHPNKYIMLSEKGFISSQGKCASFGEGGDGYIPGEGVGSVLLKSLEQAIKDNDQIYGVIKGTEINHGGRTNGFTVPNPKLQASVIKKALSKVDIPANAISYIEAHGTGTSLGDPIEIAGLQRALQRDKNNSCAIGSVKSNIGHAEAAAGISGVTKVLLQMKHKQLVPSIHSKSLNTNIDFNNSGFRVQQHLEFWKKPIVKEGNDFKEYDRIAGVSSFGAGGSNAHLIVEEYDNSPKAPVDFIPG